MCALLEVSSYAVCRSRWRRSADSGSPLSLESPETQTYMLVQLSMAPHHLSNTDGIIFPPEAACLITTPCDQDYLSMWLNIEVFWSFWSTCIAIDLITSTSCIQKHSWMKPEVCACACACSVQIKVCRYFRALTPRQALSADSPVGCVCPALGDINTQLMSPFLEESGNNRRVGRGRGGGGGA